MRDNNSGFSRVTLIIIILVVLIIGAGAASFGVFEWRGHEVGRLNDKVSSLNSQIDDLNGQISIMSKSLSKACSNQTSNTCSRYDYSSQKGVSVIVYAPQKNTSVNSPVAIIGEVPGTWSFEAQFPILLEDSIGRTISKTTAHILGNWQTSQLVPFSAQLTFSGSYTGNGTLVIQKDNP